MKQKKIIMFGTLFVVMLGVIAVYFMENSESQLSEERITQLRENYPAYNESPPFMNQGRMSLDEVVDLSESYVLAEAVKQLPDYEVDLSGLPGSAESEINKKLAENGVVQTTSITYHQYEFKVLELINGKPTEDTIVVTYSSEFTGYLPEFKSGMKVILPLGAETLGSKSGKYGTTKFGMYYVIDDQYVLSAVDNEFTKSMNGRTLKELNAYIQNAKNNP